MKEQLETSPQNPEVHPYRSVFLFNRDKRQFEHLPEATVITIDTYQGAEPDQGKSTLFADLKLYDIGATMVLSLRVLEQRFPGCFVTFFGAHEDIIECVNAGLRVNLIADATLVPDEIKQLGKEPQWKEHIVQAALDAGCAGVLVDFDPSAFTAAYPDRYFFATSDNYASGSPS